MDRSAQEPYLLSDYEITAVDSSAGDTHTNDSVQTAFASLDGSDTQTVFTSLGGSTVLNESGYHHVTIAVDPQTDLASLGGINQGQNILVLPASSFNDQRTYILQTGVRIQTDNAGGNDSQILLPQVITADATASHAETTGSVFTTDSDGGATISVENSVGQLQEECQIEADDQEAVTFVKPSEVFIDRNALLDPKKYAVQPSRIAFQPHKLQPPIPIVICKCDTRKNNVKAAQTIFTSVQANLSKKLMEAIPGCTSSFLRQFVTQHELNMDNDEDGNESEELRVGGELHKLLCLHDNLSQLLSATEDDLRDNANQSNINKATDNKTKQKPNPISFPRVITKDKGTNCDIIQPQYSRSGRQIKRRNLDLPTHEEPKVTIEASPSGNTRGMSKRGRRGKAPANLNYIKNGNSVQESPECVDTTGNQTSMLDLIAAISNSEPIKTSAIVVKKEECEDNNTKHILVMEPTDVNLPEEDLTFHSIKITGSDTSLSVAETVYFSAVSQELNQSESGGTPREGDDGEMNSLSEKENSQDLDGLVGNKIRVSGATSTTAKLSPNIVLGKRRHKKDYESLAPYKFHCNMCSFKSKRKSHYLKHTLVHKKSLPLLQCKECKFTTVRLSHLRRHQLTHSAQVFMCKMCKYRTDDMKRLQRHYRIKHVSNSVPSNETDQVQIYACKTCDYKTLKAHQYFRHLRCHASVDGNPESGETAESYQCPLCPYKTTRKEHYSRHVGNVHSDRRPFLCDTCGKAFKRADALRQHKMVHQDKTTRTLRHTCQDCLKSFRSQAHLIEHKTIHTNKREYLCEICGAAFKTRSVQRKHVQSIHQNPRSHACTSCPKRFNTKYALQRHIRTHDTPGMRSVTVAMEQSDTSPTVTAVSTTADTTSYIIQDLPTGTAEEGQVVTGEATIEEAYEQNDDGTLRTGPQTAYIQSSEANNAILYISSIQPY